PNTCRSLIDNFDCKLIPAQSPQKQQLIILANKFFSKFRKSMKLDLGWTNEAVEGYDSFKHGTLKRTDNLKLQYLSSLCYQSHNKSQVATFVVFATTNTFVGRDAMALESDRHSPNNTSSPDPAGSCQCCHQNQPPAENERVSLPFSVANILKPDFGRRAVISSRHQETFLYRHPNLPRSCRQHLRRYPVRVPLSPASSTVSATSSTQDEKISSDGSKGPQLWPAWVYCTRYSDRPSSVSRKHNWTYDDLEEDFRASPGKQCC
ncbi:hypothetical protein L9F63_006914, partial [Diploptera punctata]